MIFEEMTLNEYKLVRQFLMHNLHWTVNNHAAIMEMMRKAQRNVEHLAAHPVARPAPEQMIMAIFLMVHGKVVEHADEIVSCVNIADVKMGAIVPISEQDARNQVQSLLAKIKSELG